MSETIDKLIYALDGDLTNLKSAFAQAEAEAQKSGTKIGDSVSKPLADAAKAATKSATDIQKALGGTTTAATAQAKELENLRSKYDSTFAAQQKAATIQGELNKLVAAGVMTNSQAAKTFEQMTAAVVHGHGATSTATREFRALFDELSSGRTRMTPGTLAIIATRVFGISGATLAWGAALAAIPLGLAVAAIQAENLADRVERSLKATGFAAGVTRDQLFEVAEALDKTARISVRGAIDVGTELTAHGNVQSGQLKGAIQATSNFAGASGLSLDKAGEQMEKMLSSPSKAAEELNAQFKLLSVAQVEEIKNLEASGEKAKAQQVLIDQMNNSWGHLEDASWSLAKAWNATAKGLSDWWNHTGANLSGAGPGKTSDSHLAQLLQIQARLNAEAAHYPGGHLPIADEEHRRLTIGPEIKALTDKIAGGNAAAATGQLNNQANAAVGAALEDARKGAGEYEAKLKDLDNEMHRDQLAVAMLGKVHGQFSAEIIAQVTRQADAAKKAHDAFKEYGDPAKEAATRHVEQERINRARPENRARISAEVDAARTYRKELQDPRTALLAQGNYQEAMKTADAPDRFSKQGAERAKAIAEVQAQAAGEEQLARAYGVSAAAAEQARIATEAHVKTVQMNIKNTAEAARFEKQYADALRERAYWQAAAATSQRTETIRVANAGLQGEIAAGGNPFALADARRHAEAQSQTAGEFNDANTVAQLMRAVADMTKLEAQLKIRDTSNAQIGAQSDLYSSRLALSQQQQYAGAFANGASDDDLRRLKVAQGVMDDLVRRGIDPSTDANKKLFDQMVQTSTAASDLADNLQKAQAYAQELSKDITSPLKGFLTGKESALDAASSAGENLADTLIQKQIIDPLDKKFTSIFSDALGGTLSADGTMTSPYYVIPLGPGGIPSLGGGGLGGGGLFNNMLGGGDTGGMSIMDDGSLVPSSSGGLFGDGGLLGNLFGGGGGGAGAASSIMDDGTVLSSASEGSGILETLLSFAGLFDDGGTIAPGQWGVKSGIPEIIQGGTAGVSVMPVGAPMVTAAIGSGRGNGSGGYNDGGGATTVVNEGDTHNTFNLPGVRDQATAVHARSQLERLVTTSADRGNRNK